ncbi:hypothetical protein K1726_03610 [Clostridium estertheticum]|nr:hypothetical protein [Clostridium estertheticum]MBX4263716.1 hypothetical protein [Clostridium estertheticum]
MVLNPAAWLQDKNKFGSSAQVYSWALFFRKIYNDGYNKIIKMNCKA